MSKLILILLVAIACAGCVPPAPPPPPPSAVSVVSTSNSVAVSSPKSGIVDMPAVSYPKNAIVRQKPLSSIEVYPGSLKENVQRIAAHYGWHQVVWDAPQDFMWVGKARIQGENLSSILQQLLNDYPLQAVFYQGNHVLYIHPRTLK